LVPLRMLLGNIGVIVLPDQVAVSKAMQAFTPNGDLQDSRQHQSIKALGANVAHMLSKIHA